MQLENLTKEQFIRDFKDTLHQEQLIKVAKATPTEIFTALAGLIRKYYTNTWIERNHALSDNQEKIAYYFSIEFLPGRMLETNLLNLGILDPVKEGFAELDIDFREVVEAEHDMALGNGGLGRLAAASWIHLRLLVILVLVTVFVTAMDYLNNVLLMVTRWNYQMVGLVLQVMFGKHVKTTILSM